MREKSIRLTWESIYCNNVRCKNLKPVKNVVQHVAATNVALKIFWCNNIVLKLLLKIVPCNITLTSPLVDQ